MYESNLPWDIFMPVTYPKVAYDRYVISNSGVIIDVINGHMVTKSIDKNGFEIVSLFTNEPGFKIMSVRVHRLVAWEFCPENRLFDNGVRHIDKEKLNNYYKNLEWLTCDHTTKKKNKIPKKYWGNDMAIHVINTYYDNPPFYNCNPNAFLQHIKRHHPNDEVTLKLIREIIKDAKKCK